ncbi:MAG: glutamate racemase [Lachnospiraceae bacterium]|nr:glutamate racemase [Lachnospiraceae bacterium]
MFDTIDKETDFIGVFDSGVGGISVLKCLAARLPKEDFLFYGDSANAPYGEKSEEQVQKLSLSLADRLLERGAKAIVIACNTATSAAAETIRARYPDIVVVGVEPAVKPAAMELSNGKVLVMATPMTLEREKYRLLASRFDEQASLIPLACPGLAARIEKGDLEGEDLKQMLEGFLRPYAGSVDGVVLGCTHYPFIRKQIAAILGDVPMFDGAEGTARELERRLKGEGLLTKRKKSGRIIFDSSRKEKEELALYERFYALPS